MAAEGEGLDELEYKSLLGAISQVETTLANSLPGTQPLLDSFLTNAKTRLDFLARKLKEQTEEKEHHEKEQLAIARLAQNEAALSESEKETYSGFLAKEFFTKKDFKGLEQFYSQTWDRLSDGGRDEMSHRIWEGIRRDEYRFTDLPRVVQEKEEDRLYYKLTNSDRLQDSLKQIPEGDRNDFIHAYESGEKKEVGKVLNRESFRHNVALENSAGTKHQTADTGKEVNDQAAVDYAKSKADSPNKPSVASASSAQFADIALDTLKSNGVSLVSASSPPTAAALPDASGPNVKVR